MRTSILTLAIILCFGKSPAVGFVYQTLDVPGALNTIPMGVEYGVVVGYYSPVSPPVIPTHGFIYDGSSFTTIDFPGADATAVTDLSGSRFVGYYFDSTVKRHGFIYEAGVYTTLDDPLTSKNNPSNGTEALGVSGNNIVGDYIDDNGITHAYLFDGSTFVTLHPAPTGISYATAVDGQKIIGLYTASGVYHGYVYDGTTYTTFDHPLGTQDPGTDLFDVFGNSIVGAYENVPNIGHGFLYDGASFTTIDYPGAKSTAATGIWGNTIVGAYVDSRGRNHGFITLVPEPSSLLLLAIGAISLLSLRKHARR